MFSEGATPKTTGLKAARFATSATLGALLLFTAGCGSQNPNPAEGDQTGQSQSESQGDASSQDDASAPRDVFDDPPEKTWQDALDAAKSNQKGEPKKIELERRDAGGLEYKVELVSNDGVYKVQFDADSLEVLSEKSDSLDDDGEDQDEMYDPADAVDLEKAAGAARDAQAGTITSWKLEGKDNGRVLYEFDILPDGASDDVEVKVDAKSGEVVDVD